MQLNLVVKRDPCLSGTWTPSLCIVKDTQTLKTINLGKITMNSNSLNYRLFCAAALCAVTILGLSQAANATIYRVDGTNGSCSGDGSGWGSNAYLYLQDALENINLTSGDQIWVAQGEYFVDQDCANPTGSGSRSESYVLISGVKMYGGFEGVDETLLSERDPAMFITILSGIVVGPDPDGTPYTACTDPDVNAGDCFEVTPGIPGCIDPICCDIVCDFDLFCCESEWDLICADQADVDCRFNAYHVVTAGTGLTITTVIDGFTIQEGFADGTGNDGVGGGMLIDNASPAVVRCIFINNSAPGHGGGAIQIGGNSHPFVVNCTMTENQGIFGGAIHMDPAPASATLVNCLINDNLASGSGGGIDARSGEPATLDLINCTVTDNTALGTGGGI